MDNMRHPVASILARALQSAINTVVLKMKTVIYVNEVHTNYL